MSRSFSTAEQGGIIETADRVTTHDNPNYLVDGVVHYAVANMSGAVARTSTQALTNATLPYALELANKGSEQAIADSTALRTDLNIYRGKVTNQAVAASLGLDYSDI